MKARPHRLFPERVGIASPEQISDPATWLTTDLTSAFWRGWRSLRYDRCTTPIPGVLDTRPANQPRPGWGRLLTRHEAACNGVDS